MADLTQYVSKVEFMPPDAEAPVGPAGPGDRLMLPSEAAEVLRLDAKTLSRWARDEVIPAVRLPSGHYRVWSSTIEAILSGELRPTRYLGAKLARRRPHVPGQMPLPLDGA